MGERLKQLCQWGEVQVFLYVLLDVLRYSFILHLSIEK